MINLFKIFLKNVHVSYFQHFTNWNVQYWVLLSLSTMISKINTWQHNKKICSLMNLDCWMNFDFDGLQRNEQFASITPDFHRELSCGSLQCGWFILRLTRVLAAGYELRLILSYDWLRLTRVPAAGYELRLIPSPSWFESQRLNTSCGWFHLTAVWSSGGWMRVVALSCGWLESRRLDTSYSWFHLAADFE